MPLLAAGKSTHQRRRMMQLSAVRPRGRAPGSRGAEGCAKADVRMHLVLRGPQAADRFRCLRRQGCALRHWHAAPLCWPPRPQGSLQPRTKGWIQVQSAAQGAVSRLLKTRRCRPQLLQSPADCCRAWRWVWCKASWPADAAAQVLLKCTSVSGSCAPWRPLVGLRCHACRSGNQDTCRSHSVSSARVTH